MNQSILHGLLAYDRKECYSWHMPGHKRKLNTIFPQTVENPFRIDVTEVGDLDEFHHPEGIIQEAFERAAKIYGAKRSYYLVNGSTCGLLAAISAVCKSGDSLIVARNCHKSVYNALRLLNIEPIYIMPEWNETLGMFGGIDKEVVKNTLLAHSKAKGIILVSPTYEGVISDIEQISELAHEAGMPLIVDAAHGAHFEYMGETEKKEDSNKALYLPAIRAGADLVIESLHKTLPAMTQCAILHENSQLIDRNRLEEFLSIYQSTSPSYVFMATMEACIEKMNSERNGLCILYQERLNQYRKRLEQLTHIRLVKEDDFIPYCGYGYDVGKLVFFVEHCGIMRQGRVCPVDGVVLGEILEQEYGQIMEMAGGNYVIAMTSIADNDEAFEALEQAMRSIDERLMDLEKSADNLLYNILPKQHMRIAKAREQEAEEVPIKEAVGRVSHEYIYVYPPGIPLIVPGEIFSVEILNEIEKAVDKHLNIKGLVKREHQIYLSVIKS